MMIRRLALTAVTSLAIGAVAAPGTAGAEPPGQPISGAGSTWAQPAVRVWGAQVGQRGLRVQYGDTGSTDGRRRFATGAMDFAVSETPYGLDGVDQPPARPFASVPFVGGGLAFMYNLTVDGRRVTDLRLSGETLTGVFLGDITRWDDPRVKADNPGINLPAKAIKPVVRSDGSGPTAVFTGWLSARYPDRWSAYCQAHGRPAGCGATLSFPLGGQVAQLGSTGVAGTVVQPANDGAIGYVEYSYALSNRMPAAKVLNQAGYYVAPTASAVGVALSGADVFGNPDRRAYPVSYTAQLIVPTTSEFGFNEQHGYTLSEFGRHALCGGSQSIAPLGYAPLPIDLVRSGLQQLQGLAGAVVQADPLIGCDNPTIGPGGTDKLLATAPQPPECDRQGGVPCTVTGPSDRRVQQVDADVAVGAFSMAVAGDVAVLGGGTVGGSATGALPEVTVTDLRGTTPGWNVTAQVEDFTHSAQPAATIPGAQLGWVPLAHDQGGSGHVAAGVPVAPGTVAGGLPGGATLCSAAPGGSAGTFTCTAALTLAVPDSTLPGTYAATLTLTLA